MPYSNTTVAASLAASKKFTSYPGEYRKKVTQLRKNPPSIEIRTTKLAQLPILSRHGERFGIVYALTCKPNNRRYIGITQTFETSCREKILNQEKLAISDFSRWENHLINLIEGTHPKTELQQDWDFYGIDHFFFEVLDVVFNKWTLYSEPGSALCQLEAYYHFKFENNYSSCRTKYKGGSV